MAESSWTQNLVSYGECFKNSAVRRWQNFTQPYTKERMAMATTVAAGVLKLSNMDVNDSDGFVSSKRVAIKRKALQAEKTLTVAADMLALKNASEGIHGMANALITPGAEATLEPSADKLFSGTLYGLVRIRTLLTPSKKDEYVLGALYVEDRVLRAMVPTTEALNTADMAVNVADVHSTVETKTKPSPE